MNKAARIQNSVELLEQAIEYAKSHGFTIRMELLDGISSGYCRIGDAKHIFLDQSATAQQQLSDVMQAIQKGNASISPTNV